MSAVSHARIAGLVFITSLLCAFAAAAPAWSRAPVSYDVTRVDPPQPAAGQAFGSQMAVADLDQDRTEDLVIVAPGATPAESQVIARNGATGAPLWPQRFNPDPAGGRTYGASIAAIVDPATGTDVGGFDCSVTPCVKQDTPDGFPDVLVSAVDTNDASGDDGLVYVLDGVTGLVLKRIAIGAQPASGTAQFGRSVYSPGDVDFDLIPDVVVGAPAFTQSGHPQTGAVFVYSGADLAGSPDTPLTAAVRTVLNPYADVGGFGKTLLPSGDVGTCIVIDSGSQDCTGSSSNIPRNVPDGIQDILIGAPASTVAGLPNAGTVVFADVRFGKVLRRVDHPAPQIDARFGDTLQRAPASADLSGDGIPDSFVGAPGHGASEGTGYVVNGDIGGPPVLSSVPDPAPAIGGGFGTAAASFGGEGFAVGVPFAGSGIVRAFNRDRSLARTICNPDGQAGSAFGASIVALSDPNGDTLPDLVVAAPGFDHDAAPDAGRVYILTSSGPPAAGDRLSCQPSATPDGGEPDDDGSSDFPPDDDVPTTSRAARRLTMKPNKGRVRKEAYFRLRGRLTASARPNVCQRRQKIALQRRKAAKGAFQTFEVAVTRPNGKFTARAIATRTYAYRARVSQTTRCKGATSKTSRVRILRARSAR